MVHSLPESKFACLDNFLEKGLPKVDIKKLCKTKRNNILAGRKKLKEKGVWNLDRDIIDAGAGKNFRQVTSGYVPTITCARASGDNFWLDNDSCPNQL